MAKRSRLSNKDDKLEVPSPAPSLSCLAEDVKEPTHYSKRVGHGVPGVVVWSWAGRETARPEMD